MLAQRRKVTCGKGKDLLTQIVKGLLWRGERFAYAKVKNHCVKGKVPEARERICWRKCPNVPTAVQRSATLRPRDLLA